MQPRILNEFAHFSPIQIVICHGTRLLLSAMNSGLQIIVLGSVFFYNKKHSRDTVRGKLSSGNFSGVGMVFRIQHSQWQYGIHEMKKASGHTEKNSAGQSVKKIS